MYTITKTKKLVLNNGYSIMMIFKKNFGIAKKLFKVFLKIRVS